MSWINKKNGKKVEIIEETFFLKIKGHNVEAVCYVEEGDSSRYILSVNNFKASFKKNDDEFQECK